MLFRFPHENRFARDVFLLWMHNVHAPVDLLNRTSQVGDVNELK